MRNLFLIVGIMMFLFTPASVSANQAADTKRQLGLYIEDALDAYNIPGATLKIMKNGETFYENNWGAMSDGVGVTSDTPFLIGSISKTITSLALMMLVEDGKIKLEEPISTYIPSFTYKTDSLKEIRVLDLLQQTSGISQFEGLKVTDKDTNEKEAISKAVANLSGVELAEEPGALYEYNSANYLLLGSIIEQVSGQSYTAFINKNIFDPLGMNHSAADYERAVVKGFVPGFKSWFGYPVKSLKRYDNSGAPYGYTVSSANDLAKFLTFMQDGGELLSEEYLERLRTPPEAGSYGLGWHFSKTEHFPFHGGATPDYRAEMFYIPEQDYAAVLLTNKHHLLEDPQVHYIMEGVRSIMSGNEPAELPETIHYIQWIVLEIVLVIALLTIGHIVMLKKRGTRRSKWPYIYGVLLVLIAAGIIPLLAYAMNSPWRTITLFAPDISFLIYILVGIVAINGMAPFFLVSFSKKN